MYVYPKQRDEYRDPPVSQKAMCKHNYHTMHLYLQNRSNLQTIDIPVKQCNMGTVCIVIVTGFIGHQQQILAIGKSLY